MTGKELLEYIEWLGASRKDLADYLEVGYRTLTRWINGESPVPRMMELIVKGNCIKMVEVPKEEKKSD